MTCSHELDAEYLYPSDTEVIDISESADELTIAILVPCPACDQTLRLETMIDRIVESSVDLPLDDSTDLYD